MMGKHFMMTEKGFLDLDDVKEVKSVSGDLVFNVVISKKSSNKQLQIVDSHRRVTNSFFLERIANELGVTVNNCKVKSEL